MESERVTRLLNDADVAASMMAAMLDELLDLTRMEAGRPLELRRRQIDLSTLARQAAADYERAAPNHLIVVEHDGQPLPGDWDPTRLERMLTNLLSNAVKYSPVGGAITLSLSRQVDSDGAWACLSVRDQGLGIPIDDLPFIFERFHRAANVVGKVSGVGIGLAGAKQIVEQHGGSMTVESREGEGSTFTVRLPSANRTKENSVDEPNHPRGR